VAIIVVPTPVDELQVPDLSFLRSATRGLSEVMGKGTLVIVESTTYPDATEEIVVADFRDHGFTPGVDVFIGFSPERIDPRNEKWNVTNTPKLVSGLTEHCLELALALYSSVVDTLVPVSNIRTAEMAKLFENVFRNVNIALVNELRVICDQFDVDVWEVIAACSTKPYGFMPFYPGPGVGGHCIPVDPFYLSWKADQRNISTEFIDLAARINGAVPRYIVQKAAQLLSNQGRKLSGARVGLLGVAYKKNTSDVRETPATHIVELLLDQGAIVGYFDPHVPTFRVGDQQFVSTATLAEFLAAHDCIIVAADHDAIDWALVLQYAPIVLDTRNAIGKLKPTGLPQRVGRSRE
jgi:UDP-N-acetyl-D-glucosamine dehydrogenase